MIYLTFNDAPGGIYYSQVTDVIHFLRNDLHVNIRLVAIISVRNFRLNKKKIRAEEPDAIVIPMFPKVVLWKYNLPLFYLLSFIFDFEKAIARGPYSTWLALRLKKLGRINRVCFDARGAYEAEFNEYNVINDKKIKLEIEKVERTAVLTSDYRLAVSNKLVNYWQTNYNYSQENHVVIPCTLNSNHFIKFPEKIEIEEIRKGLKLAEDDIVLIYSGSSSGWQSLTIVNTLLTKLMETTPHIKIIFLLERLPEELTIVKKFKGHIIHKWVKPNEVGNLLLAADYGILIREKSVTNRVSSPTKFAEYLASGLSVLISEEIGDYTEFVEKHRCGIIVQNENIILERKTLEEKRRINDLAIKNFTKQFYADEYKKIVAALNN